jgi:hypothetical protein
LPEEQVSVKPYLFCFVVQAILQGFLSISIIAAIVLFLCALWIIAFALLAAAFGMINNGLIQLSELRKKDI